MSKKSNPASSGSQASTSDRSWFAGHPADRWQTLLSQVAARFNREYGGEPLNLPEEVEAMPIFREWVAGTLASKTVSPFWELAKPQKNQRCLDLGCGVSFLIYPWRDWEAYFYGADICTFAQEALNGRGPQLNSKLFKGVQLEPAHQLSYEAGQFDLCIATGFSFYFPLDSWETVLAEVKRVLKPSGTFVFDVINPDTPVAEDWAILETYRGTEVFLEPAPHWEKLIKAASGRVVKRQQGALLDLYKIQF